MNKKELSPLSWSILFFSMWYTILSMQNESYNWFAWLLFGFSLILLVSIYIEKLYDIMNSTRFVNIVLPTIFIVTVASFMIGVLQVLGDLVTTNQWIALVISFLLIGSMMMCWIAKWPRLNARIAVCIIIAIVFIVRMVTSGFEGSWPLIIILVQIVWATLQPDRFARIPVV